jgi:glutamine synthetase
MKLGLNKIPSILLDNTDRNRTSPFAFTGNKFEFRAVGSSANSANAMTVLNTIVADQLFKFKRDVEAEIKKGTKKEVAIADVLRKAIKDSKKIRFEGNGYSDEWAKEAEKRGLSNVKTTAHALEFYVTKKSTKLFIENGVYSERELHARHEIMLEDYTKKIQIESRIMGDLALNHIIPTAIAYQNKLITNYKGLKDIGLKAPETVLALINDITTHIDAINKNVENMVEARKTANNIEDAAKKAVAYCDDVKKFFDPIRYAVDKLELIVDDEDWPLVKYREMLFLR